MAASFAYNNLDIMVRLATYMQPHTEDKSTLLLNIKKHITKAG